MPRAHRLVLTCATLLAGLAVAALPTAGAGPRQGKRPPAAAPAATTATTATATTAPAVVTRVQDYYRGIDHARVRFTQEVTNVTFGRTDSAGGTVWLARPGKMRWQYEGKPRKGKVPVAKDFLSDGKTLYLLDHENRQVVHQRIADSALPAAVAFLQGQGSLASDYHALLETRGGYGPAGSVVLRLDPKAPTAQLASLHLVVDPTDFHVAETIVTDGAGNTSRFRFEPLDTASAIRDATFRVDLRSRDCARTASSRRDGGQGPPPSWPSVAVS